MLTFFVFTCFQSIEFFEGMKLFSWGHHLLCQTLRSPFTVSSDSCSWLQFCHNQVYDHSFEILLISRVIVNAKTAPLPFLAKSFPFLKSVIWCFWKVTKRQCNIIHTWTARTTRYLWFTGNTKCAKLTSNGICFIAIFYWCHNR